MTKEEFTASRTKICPICGKEFVADHKSKIYCSRECCRKANYKKTVVSKTCPRCGKEFIASREHPVYCSADCSQLSRKENKAKFKAEESKTPFEKPVITCKYCGKEIVKAGHRKFCGAECREAYENRRRNAGKFRVNHNISEIAAKAAAKGVSYGYYVAYYIGHEDEPNYNPFGKGVK